MELETADSSWETEFQPRHSHLEGEGLQGAPQLQWGAVNEDTSDTDDLYHRIVELSDDVRQKLDESTGSYRQPGDSGVTSVTDSCVDWREERRSDICKGGGSNEEDTVQTSEANPYVESDSGPSDAIPNSPRPVQPDTTCSSRCSEKSGVHFEDTKTQKAYEKMLKLDEKLDSVCRREREVKHQRRLLEEEMERVGAEQPSNVLVSMGECIIMMLCDSVV